MLDSLHYDDFAAQLHSKFQLRAGQTAVEIELIEAQENSPSPRQEQFMLLFRAPHTAPPYQSIFQLTHATLGEGALFLVPVRQDQTSIYYEAIFNRPR